MRLRILMIAFSLVMAISPAKAEILATFYSHDFDVAYFPHAFIRLQGTIEETGEVIDTNYGFTAKRTSPAILFGSVYHMMETKKLKYVEDSDAHFTLRLDDAGYKKLMAHVEAWRDIPGKGYNLGKRNCVHFVMEAAALFDLNVNRKSKYFKKPKSFLRELKGLNPDVELLTLEDLTQPETIIADNENTTEPPAAEPAASAGQIASNPVE